MFGAFLASLFRLLGLVRLDLFSGLLAHVRCAFRLVSSRFVARWISGSISTVSASRSVSRLAAREALAAQASVARELGGARGRSTLALTNPIASTRAHAQRKRKRKRAQHDTEATTSNKQQPATPHDQKPKQKRRIKK